MNKQLLTIVIVAVLALVAVTPASATYQGDLPVNYVFDPWDHENHHITKYTFQELDSLMMNALFRKWNDLDKVCESMYLLYGKASTHCGPTSPIFDSSALIRPVTARAYISFTITPAPHNVIPTAPLLRPIMYVDPVYPPWSPTYDWYW